MTTRSLNAVRGRYDDYGDKPGTYDAAQREADWRLRGYYLDDCAARSWSCGSFKEMTQSQTFTTRCTPDGTPRALAAGQRPLHAWEDRREAEFVEESIARPELPAKVDYLLAG